MTSRDRVLTALAHKQPDRTPRDFWAEPPTWKRLFAHVGHEDKDKLLDSLGVDVRHLDAPAPPERAIGGGTYQNFWGERFIYQPTPWGPLREDSKGALAGAQSFGEALEMGTGTWYKLKALLKKAGFSTGRGDEGGFVNPFRYVKEPEWFRVRFNQAHTTVGAFSYRSIRPKAGDTGEGITHRIVAAQEEDLLPACQVFHEVTCGAVTNIELPQPLFLVQICL